uniref:RNA-dependent polymerase n=1 Tax=Diktys durna-like virus 1 TaxID=2980092 RepID=A0A977KR84_9VIRU|nr:MAG: RNA-dependent polymerase [Diktys durna-like virus 1]
MFTSEATAMARVNDGGRHGHGAPPFIEETSVLVDSQCYEIMASIDPRCSDLVEGWSRSITDIESRVNLFTEIGEFEESPPPPLFTAATQKVRDTLREKIGTVQMMSFDHELSDVPIQKDSHPGLYYTKKTKGECISEGMQQANGLANRIFATERLDRDFVFKECPPDILFARTQLSQLPQIKDRAVHGRPLHVILLEGLLFWPWIQAVLRADTPISAGLQPMELYKLLHTLTGALRFHSIDYRSFDKSTASWEVENAMNLLLSLTTFPSMRERLIGDFLTTNLIHSRLVTPYKRILELKGFIPSGSYGTFLVGSLINWIRLATLQIETQATLQYKVLGDDSAIADVDAALSLAQVIESLQRNYPHAKLHENKCFTGDKIYQIEYLGHCLRSDSLFRPYEKTLRLLCLPERHPAEHQTAAKFLAAYVDSGCNHIEFLIASRIAAERFGQSPRSVELAAQDLSLHGRSMRFV